MARLLANTLAALLLLGVVAAMATTSTAAVSPTRRPTSKSPTRRPVGPTVKPTTAKPTTRSPTRPTWRPTAAPTTKLGWSASKQRKLPQPGLAPTVPGKPRPSSSVVNTAVHWDWNGAVVATSGVANDTASNTQTYFLQVWDAKLLTLLYSTTLFHAGPVSVSRDGLVAVCGGNVTLVVNPSTNSIVRTFSNDDYDVGCVDLSLSKDGTRLTALSRDNTTANTFPLETFNVTSGDVINKFDAGLSRCAESPTGFFVPTCLAISPNNTFAVGGSIVERHNGADVPVAMRLNIVNHFSGEVLGYLHDHRDLSVAHVEFLPDGNRVFIQTTSTEQIVAAQAQRFAMWSFAGLLDSGSNHRGSEYEYEYELPSNSTREYESNNSTSSNSTSEYEYEGQEYETPSDGPAHELPSQAWQFLAETNNALTFKRWGGIPCAAVSPDGQYVAVCSTHFDPVFGAPFTTQITVFQTSTRKVQAYFYVDNDNTMGLTFDDSSQSLLWGGANAFKVFVPGSGGM